MKYIKNISTLIISIIFFSATGCSFLDQKVYGDEEGFWVSEESVTSAIIGMYEFTRNEGVAGRGVMWFENCSDNMVTGRSQSEGDDIKNFRMIPKNTRDVRHMFPQMYMIVARANDIIRNAPNIPKIDPVFLEEAIAEAHFMRGFAYLWLVPYYGDDGINGGLPNVTDKTPIEDVDMPRPESILENYDQIISDMRVAADKLPLLSQRLGSSVFRIRPHKAAAWAFGARAALYASQYRDNATQDRYRDIVIEFTNNIMALAGADARDLYDDNTDNAFGNLWRSENNYSREYIYSLPGSAQAGPKFHGMSFENQGWGDYNHWGYFQPTYELVQAYAEGDIRLKATILLPGDKVQFVGRIRHFCVDSPTTSTSRMVYRKFISPWESANCSGTTVSSNSNDSSNDLGTSLMRFSDVLLMRAEALIWKHGEGNAEAKTLLNRVRKRARLPENSGATRAELKNERRCELATELQPSRHLDLVRWGDAQQIYAQPLHGADFVVNNDNSVTVSRSVIPVWGPRTFNPQRHHVFPIPDKSIQSSKTLIQNKGY